MSNVEFREWCHSHNLKIIDTNKRFARFRPLSIDFFCNPSDYNIISQETGYDTEPLYTVEIPLGELEKMAEFESQVFGNLKSSGHYNMFHILMEQKEKEKYLRKKYPAVEAAYSNYSLILKLAESGEI